MYSLHRFLRICIRQSSKLEQISSVTTFFQHPVIETGIEIKPFEAIPGPTKLPYFKSSWVFLPLIGRYDTSRLEKSHLKLYEDYGKIVRLEYPIMSVVMLYDHELFQRVSDIEGLFPRRNGFVYSADYRKNNTEKYPNRGLFMLWGDKWRDLRHSTHKPMLRFNSVRQYVNPMDQIAKEFIERVRTVRNENMEIDDFQSELILWAIENVGVFALNKKFHCFDNPQDNDAIRMHILAQEFFDQNAELEFNAGWKSHFTKKTLEKAYEADEAFTELRKRKFILSSTVLVMFKDRTIERILVYKFLSEALDERKTDNPKNKNGGPSLLDSFLSEERMNMDKLKGIMLDIFLAGSTTVTAVSTFLLYHLASQKIQQERLYEEIRREFPTKDSPITLEKFDKMPYLRACVKENLRLHPVVVGTGRMLNYDVSVAGYHIPKNTLISSITPLTSRMEKYFEFPNDFVPERWLGLYDMPEAERLRQSVGLDPKYTTYPHSAVPFGHGIRMCAGRRFAEQEMFILLIRLIRNFSVDYENQKPLEMKQGFLNVPAQKVRFKFTERRN